MVDLLARLVAIVLLRLGPQDLPSGTAPLVLAIVLYLAVTGLAMIIGHTPDNPALILLLAVALPLVLVRIVLALRQRPGRWAQTLTALFGTSVILTAISLPLAMLNGNGEPPLPALLASLALFVWSFAIDAHIWRHALEVTLVTALAVAVVLFAISLFVINTLAGPL